MGLSEETLRYIDEHSSEFYELLLSLSKVPSPSHHEERRAEFVRSWLTSNGADDVEIDGVKNVICRIGNCSEGPLVVFMAHLDVVFSDTDELLQKVEDGRIWCPGVGDDTANLVAMLFAVKYILEMKLEPKSGGVLVVANSCEEGLGDLKGSRAIMERYGKRVERFISFDSWNGCINHKSIGSRRFRISVETEGGHSYYDFGNRSAIRYLSEMVTRLYGIEPPSKGTTYNVGAISGGTSVNTIAQRAEMLYEYRSDSIENGTVMEKRLNGILDDFREMGIRVDVEVIGDRPCMGKVDEKEMERLMDRSAEIYREYYGKEPVFKAGSTDCNIPLSLGIPSICVGCFDGGGAHTREEYVLIDSLRAGYRVAFAHMLDYFA